MIQEPIAGDLGPVPPIGRLGKDSGAVAVKTENTLLAHLPEKPLIGERRQIQDIPSCLIHRWSKKLPIDLSGQNIGRSIVLAAAQRKPIRCCGKIWTSEGTGEAPGV